MIKIVEIQGLSNWNFDGLSMIIMVYGSLLWLIVDCPNFQCDEHLEYLDL